MRFNHKKGASRSSRSMKSKIMMALAVVMAGAGIYLLSLILYPNVSSVVKPTPVDVAALPGANDNRIYIPKIGVNIPYFTGGTEALEKGAWHRYPERGDPEKGGNFIISAHRFSLGLTPGQTRQKSPFYHIDRLEVGDDIIVDFNKKRYGYKVSEKLSVKPTQVEIEAPLKEGEDPKLTLYTCTLKGESDGREVVIADFLGEVEGDKVETF